MKKCFLVSLISSLTPIIIFTIIAITQLGEYSYTKLGGIVIMIQAGYTVLLLPVTTVFFILKKKDISLGLLVSFFIGLFALIITFGMGL